MTLLSSRQAIVGNVLLEVKKNALGIGMAAGRAQAIINVLSAFTSGAEGIDERLRESFQSEVERIH